METSLRAQSMRPIRAGSRLAVIAPSSPFDVDALEAGIARLRQRYRVTYDEGIWERRGFLAGDDVRRRTELERALEDEAIDGILCARGGYGATRLLAELDAATVRRAAKTLVGFSDVTALHALWARAGLRSVHGAMVGKIGQLEDAYFRDWIRVVEGGTPAPLATLRALVRGRAQGRLVGGNLAVLCALVGTPFAPPIDDCVLFLEEVGERPYRVDRMLTTLQHAGWLDRVSAVALGAFTQCDPGPDGVTVESVLEERLAGLGKPVVVGVHAGHVENPATLRLGAPVVVTADSTGGSLTWSSDP